ncbi:hypothetical protein ANME2D_01623 [Candidatus Methanoperedens nitroreducens]|uniref:Uncharacterized protein n=1 Tax=Candidatus Methanoperedens nitratireducens TaxID=1392998 RepID=A0A062V8X5_9EURY|nr:hypothetical protein [Candidatus Methanoperedens nitroreducens]KCZ72219.1 hypothetical protein ANME2D_01623 [Candidatus Methanoperedens nitroreducens]MDJ1421803.1 hypothetical protein [Candidatus Methanoperedens sp.]
MPFDFTLTKFRALCSAIAQHYPTLTLAEYFGGLELPDRFAMMRHDIDRRAGSALGTARVEQELGVKAIESEG